jgi:Retrotransposon hot spot protein
MKDYEDIPNSDGMRVLRDVALLGDDADGSDNIVLRTITEDFWQKVIQGTETHRICALGTPGIGKSFSTCILIRLLLKAKKNVVYHYRYGGGEKNCFVYFFTPSTGKSDYIDVKVIAETEFDKSDTAVDNNSIYYIVDPGKTKDSCDPNEVFRGKVIIVASPDERHWGKSEFEKSRLGYKRQSGSFRYFPVWTLEEILAAAHYFPKAGNASLPDDEIIERFNVVGGVPRLIFEKSIKDFKKKQRQALGDLSPAFIDSLVFDGYNLCALHTTNLPRGILLSYILAEDDNGSYQNGIATLRSDSVYVSIAQKYKKQIWASMLSRAGEFDKSIFEEYTKSLFYIDKHDPKILNATIRNCVPKASPKKVTHILIGGCRSMKTVYNIVEAAIETEMVLFSPVSKNYKLIDFIYRDGNVYNMFQSTMSKSGHTSNANHTVEFVTTILNATAPALLQQKKILPSPNGTIGMQTTYSSVLVRVWVLRT